MFKNISVYIHIINFLVLIKLTGVWASTTRRSKRGAASIRTGAKNGRQLVRVEQPCKKGLSAVYLFETKKKTCGNLFKQKKIESKPRAPATEPWCKKISKLPLSEPKPPTESPSSRLEAVVMTHSLKSFNALITLITWELIGLCRWLCYAFLAYHNFADFEELLRRCLEPIKRDK